MFYIIYIKHLSLYLRCQHVCFSIYILTVDIFHVSSFCILFLISHIEKLLHFNICPSISLKRQTTYTQTPPSNKTKTPAQASKPSFGCYVESVVVEYNDGSVLNWDIKWQTVACEVVPGVATKCIMWPKSRYCLFCYRGLNWNSCFLETPNLVLWLW